VSYRITSTSSAFHLRTRAEARRADTMARISIGNAASTSFPLKLKSHEVEPEKVTVLLAGGNL